jgi:hypothetical protein
MAYSIRTKYFLNSNNTTMDSEYVKQLYKRNTTRKPPPALNLTEEKITQFEKSIKAKQQKQIEKNNKIHSSNLKPIQMKALCSLQQNKNLIIKPTDKNLAPALMDLETYIKQVLQEHLLTNDYIQSSHEEMRRKMSILRSTLQDMQK